MYSGSACSRGSAASASGRSPKGAPPLPAALPGDGRGARPARRPEHPLYAALAQQDPLIGLRQDDERQETYVSLYGEVQKEVIQQTPAEEFGLAVTFQETTTICVERPAGSGAAAEFIAQGGRPGCASIRGRPGPG